MHNWEITLKRSLKHQLSRCKKLASSHNPDYMLKYANECKQFAKHQDDECVRRLKKEQDLRLKNAFQHEEGPILKRYNRNV